MDTGWKNVSVGDEVILPAGIIYERRVLDNGQIQVRNPVFVSVCNPQYLRLVLSMGAVA